MGRPKGMKDQKPRENGRMAARGLPDALGYRYSDSGCAFATEFLGHQSSCLDCPFIKRCIYDKIEEEVE